MLVYCTNCSKEFNKTPAEIKKSKSGNHFCGKSCSATYNNSYRSRKDRRPNITCLNCGIKNKSSHNNQKFCSMKCSSEYKNTQRDRSVELGDNLSAKILKSYHLRHKPECSTCLIIDWQGKPLSLELDHIDGDGTNNTKTNTRLLCPNCHSQTDNYKAKNTDNPKGKDFRKKRYSRSLSSCAKSA